MLQRGKAQAGRSGGITPMCKGPDAMSDNDIARHLRRAAIEEQLRLSRNGPTPAACLFLATLSDANGRHAEAEAWRAAAKWPWSAGNA